MISGGENESCFKNIDSINKSNIRTSNHCYCYYERHNCHSIHFSLCHNPHFGSETYVFYITTSYILMHFKIIFRYCIPVVVLAQFQRCSAASGLRCSATFYYQHIFLPDRCLRHHIRFVAHVSEKWRKMEA